ncbi:MAG: DUF305 domain-containing protein [Longimicrobiales bacterium]
MLATVVALVVLAGCAGATASGGTQPVTPPAPATPPQPAPTSAAEFDAIYRARTDSAKQRFTDADVAFITGMIHHHAQAIEMSLMAPTHGARATVQTLAARIINAQKDEIGLMQRWLRDRGRPVLLVEPSGSMQMDHSDHSTMQMPGMLTTAQMQALDKARGVAFERMFLMLMIQHHRGAVTMVNTLFSTDGAGQDEAVFKLASDVQADQTSEVTRMERMLAALLSER